MSKYLVAGLGNIGPEYTNTRHNIGFKIVDALAKASTVFFTPDRHGHVCQLKWKGKTIVLLKPSTFMNLSGKAVNYWLQAEKIPRENLLVITDDIALPFGTIRIKGKGSDGGHNGLKNINEILGSTEYARLRFGVGNEFAKGKQVNYVLGEWNKKEEEALSSRIKVATDSILSFASVGLQLTMTNFNNK
ncbi:MAG TPA: aminoacyl-tRNA hydrolase [Bacteroidia bacterium]|nr:aminoacyl-tRNA hydrolase [Bacteroidia bacterium]